MKKVLVVFVLVAMVGFFTGCSTFNNLVASVQPEKPDRVIAVLQEVPKVTAKVPPKPAPAPVVAPAPQEAIKVIIYFGFDSSKLNQGDKALLDAVAAKATKIKLDVEGYTCTIGTNEYNLALSNRRANTVSDYLISKGVPKENITIIPFGESKAKGPFKNERKAIVHN